jgi:hypothetical protein
MRKWLLLLGFCWLIGPLAAPAQFIQQRFLPAHGERGTTGAPQDYPAVQINNRLFRLAPGARIYDQSNRTIVHGHLPSGVPVFYARESSGSILRIYILTEQEIAALKLAGKR